MKNITKKKPKKKKSKKIEYKSFEDVKCPICNGEINQKWFSFRNDQVIEFIAECWNRKDPGKPRHIFYFQIEVPPSVLVYGKNSTVFDE